MEKTLVINAHPKVDSVTSLSLQVYSHFIENYKKYNPLVNIEQINLYQDYVPAVDNMFMNAWDKMEKGCEITEDEQKIVNRMSEILEQFKSASRYVIVMPMHNWNIPSKLKDYMDNIIIPRETFKYTKSGYVTGLLTDNRSVLVIQASDGVYTNNDWYTEAEYSHKYLKSMFNILGIDSYEIIRAQGNAFLKQNDILSKAYREVEKVAESWIVC